jgi:uncharacterized membrane protein (UPF0136 family)
MKKTSTTPTDTKFNFLSRYQMVGGIVGLAWEVYLFINSDEINLSIIFVLVPGILFYLFSFIAGLLLFLRKSYGLKLSLFNQALQVIGFSMMGYGFEYVSGISFDIFIRYTDGLDIESNIGLSNWHILINNDTGIMELSINIVAVVLVIFILRLMKECRLERSVNEISGIGA